MIAKRKQSPKRPQFRCVLMLSFSFAVVDVRGHSRWVVPLVVAGANSIALYVMVITLKSWTASTYQKIFGSAIFNILGEFWAPTVQTAIVGLTFWLVCLWMWRQKIFVLI